jgi:hypothetical protein
VAKIIDIFDLPLVMPLDEAIDQAGVRVRQAIEVLEEDDRFHEAQRTKSLRRRIGYAMRF